MSQLLKSLFNLLFRCSHRRTTFPITESTGAKRTYVVCLDCGSELDYDWIHMKIAADGPVETAIAPVPVTH
jgi:hypothetical protein